ncbi:MAG TPA: hypothetical protein VNR11_22130 [Xanthobacteraceae bacterium]|nr:hypothetical protein [Xanthobacteraceae bacterium]
MRTYRSTLAGLAAAGLLLTAGGALAQTSGNAQADKAPADQNAPQHFDRKESGKQDNQTLSERLDQSNGVIKPPRHVDPEMHQPPPPTADQEMVIKPPVGPDGGGEARPKQ